MAVPRYGPKWRIIALILAIALVASYVWYSNNSPVTTGGTKMGLIYGFISLFLMFLLVYFGVRKRR